MGSRIITIIRQPYRKPFKTSATGCSNPTFNTDAIASTTTDIPALLRDIRVNFKETFDLSIRIYHGWSRSPRSR
ncbi:unnamed protein product [Allacma fusca]|uniref:Uncharacterized protein n=1 Tax=Allacma fusca TaxID=39272 RepID=A0A8J2NWU8_9HEXA|nr:unnamed protein product [Allacma fusca]